MYRFFYDRLSFTSLLTIILIGYFFWGWIKGSFASIHRIIWKASHGFFIAVWLAVFAYITVLSREPGTIHSIMPPMWSYKSAFIDGNYDLFQEIYLNIFLFIFFGAAACEIIEHNWWYASVAVIGIVISAGVEFLQYRFGLGLVEIDDVISNFLGTLLGITLSIFAVRFSEKVRKGFLKWLKKS